MQRLPHSSHTKLFNRIIQQTNFDH